MDKIDEILDYHGLLNKDAGLHNDIVSLLHEVRKEALEEAAKLCENYEIDYIIPAEIAQAIRELKK